MINPNRSLGNGRERWSSMVVSGGTCVHGAATYNSGAAARVHKRIKQDGMIFVAKKSLFKISAHVAQHG